MKLTKLAQHYSRKLAQDSERHDTIPAPPPSGVAEELDFEEEDELPQSQDDLVSDTAYNKSMLRQALTEFLNKEKTELEADPSYESDDYEDLKRISHFFSQVLKLVDQNL